MTELLLLVAGFVGGMINSLAGGGSFIVFPALLFAGVPPVLANASNTYAALPGYVSGTVGFWRDIARHRNRLVLYSVLALVGGYLGAELLLLVSDEQFAQVVPWLMTFAVLMFAFGGWISAAVSRLARGRSGAAATGAVLVALLLLAVSIYGGFFNAGLGILLLAALALAGMDDIHAMNGLKLWISSIVALVAVVRFVIGGTIDWYYGTIALVGVTVGGYLAARVAHLIPTPVLRALILIYGTALTGYFFWTTYG